MPTHRMKTVEVDAFHFAADYLGPKGLPMPHWVREGIEKGLIYYQGGPDPYLTFETPTGKHHVHLGEWLVRAAHGMMRWTDRSFQEMYEPLAERQEATEWR